MNQEQVLTWAREAGLGTVSEIYGYCMHGTAGAKELERFAALVAEAAVLAEREACAKVCEEAENKFGLIGRYAAAAIRAR